MTDIKSRDAIIAAEIVRFIAASSFAKEERAIAEALRALDLKYQKRLRVAAAPTQRAARAKTPDHAIVLLRELAEFIRQSDFDQWPELSDALRLLAYQNDQPATLPDPPARAAEHSPSPQPNPSPMTQPIIYTACFGDHDQPEDTDQFVGIAELHCFTDNPLLIAKLPHWNVHGRRRRFASPRMDAKWYKMSAVHLMPAAPWSIYLDASVRVKNGPALIAAVRAAMDHSIVMDADGAMGPPHASGLAFFAHPEDSQRSLEEEAVFSMTMGKYAGEPCLEQVAHYRACGIGVLNGPGPGSGQLFAGGVIGRDHTDANARFEKDWFDECVHWSTQDQLSLPFVLWSQGRAAGIIPGSIYDCELLSRVWSGPNR